MRHSPDEATAYAVNALLTAFLLTDAAPDSIAARIEIVEIVLLPMPAGPLRDTLFKTLATHRALVLELDPSLGGRC